MVSRCPQYPVDFHSAQDDPVMIIIIMLSCYMLYAITLMVIANEANKVMISWYITYTVIQ